jgi:hypothetical protein
MPAAFGDRAENPHLDIGERIAAVSQAFHTRYRRNRVATRECAE